MAHPQQASCLLHYPPPLPLLTPLSRTTPLWSPTPCLTGALLPPPYPWWTPWAATMFPGSVASGRWCVDTGYAAYAWRVTRAGFCISTTRKGFRCVTSSGSMENIGNKMEVESILLFMRIRRKLCLNSLLFSSKRFLCWWSLQQAGGRESNYGVIGWKWRVYSCLWG